MEGYKPQGSVLKKVAIGALVLAAVGLALVAVVGTDETHFQLQRANNVINRWSCPPGGYSGGGKFANCLCVKCPAGKKCLGGSNPPRPCSPGTYQPRKAQSTCLPSQPGHHVPSSGSSTQKKCPPGKYQPGSGKRSCIDASTGNYVGTSGATGQTKCPRGKFSDVRGRSACKKCTRGHKCDKVGMTRPTRCHYGTFQNQDGQTSCKQCPPANSCPSTGMTSPSLCGSNTFQHCNGQTKCIPCAPGLVAPRGSRSCSSPSANQCNNNKLAYKKPSFQSSIGGSGDANRAVDGKKDPIYFHHSCTHTAHDLHPYWFTDMGRPRSVCKVEIMNRKDCCASRLANFVIFVTNKRPSGPANKYNPTSSEICARVGPTFNGVKTFNCRKRGRYVGIQIRQNNKQYLTLCEVTVIGS